MNMGKPEDYSSGAKFPKLQLQKDEVARICIMSNQDWEGALTHFVDKMGYIKCHAKYSTFSEMADIEKMFGKPEECPLCKMSLEGDKRVNAPTRRYATKVLRYITDIKGSPMTANGALQYRIEVWLLAGKKFRQVLEKAKEWTDLRTHDLALLCTEAGFQQMDIDIKKDALWLKDKAGVGAFWKSEAPKINLEECLGDSVPVDILQRRFAFGQRNKEVAAPAGMDDEVFSGADSSRGVSSPVSSKELDNLFEGEDVKETPAVKTSSKAPVKEPDDDKTLEDIFGEDMK
jgi:hypothetical protein